MLIGMLPFAHFMLYNRAHPINIRLVPRKGTDVKNSKSIIYKRRQALLGELKKNKTIEVEETAKRLDVSPTTIRRDLNILASHHIVSRFHGGAKLIKDSLLLEEDAPSIAAAPLIDGAQKHAIAHYAASLIEDGDTIFINSSSTTLLLLDYIRDKRVIIITNSGDCVNYPHDDKVSIILTGGEVHRRHSLVGDFALGTLSKIMADKAFLGVGGISVMGGLTTSVLAETAVNEMMLRRCQGKSYVLTATPKIGREHNFLSAGIDSIDVLITCKGGKSEEIDNIKSKGIEVIELDFEE